MVKKGLQTTTRQFRGCMTLLFCTLTMVFMAFEASASVDALNQWPATPYIVSNANVASVSGKFTVSTGSSNRLMLVAVAIESSTAPTVAVTYGGQTVTQILLNTTGANRLWIGRLNNAGIVAAGTNKTLTATLTGAGTVTATYVTAAVYDGVDQTTPITGSNSLGTTATALTIGPVAYTMTGNVGRAGNKGLSVYLVNWNNTTVGQTTASTGYTEVRDYVGANFSLSANYKATTGASAESITSTTTATAIAALGAVGLNPAIKVATIASCSDCHGYPPNDGSARNVPPGQFVGAHDKHAGLQDQLNQYAYACTKCHLPAVGYNHQTGFKNISGSSLPRTAYNGTGSPKIAMSNSPQNTTCGTNNCHSTGRSNAQFTTSPAWSTSGTTTCLTCHAGRAAGNGAQANSTAGFKLSSSHSQHLKPPYSAAQINCQMCHGRTVTDAQTLKTYSGVSRHVNGVADVIFTDLTYGSYTAYKSPLSGSSGTTKTCNNLSCHGGKSRNGWQNASINTNHTCVHCHGVATTPTSNTNRNFFAPGYGGGTSTDQVSVNSDNRVGAHFVHLSSVYMPKLKCNECHRVPSTPFEATHMTGPRFSSQSLTFAQASTANNFGTTPAFTSGTAIAPAVCSVTFCHGSNMPKGDTSGTDRSVNWSQNTLMTGTPGADCGKCHGNPPTTGTSATWHGGVTATFGCTGCHANVNASGVILNKAQHADGTVQASTNCANCHDYDTRSGGTVWGNTNYGGTAGLEGRGAHAKHIEYLKSRGGVITVLNAATDTYGGTAFNAVCGVCHSQSSANHSPGTTTDPRSIDFNGSTAHQFGGSAPSYNGIYNTSSGVDPKSCSNTDCHYKTSPIWSTY